MVRKSKWIKGSSPDQPVSDAARRALSNRLKLVWRYLPLAAEKPEEDVEHMHQLRVATRRAAAALRLFPEMLPKRRAKWFRRNLRKVRRAAGEARDLDVLMERLAREAAQAPPAAVSKLLHRAALRRFAVQAPVRDIYRRLEKKNFQRRVRRFVQQIRWRGPQPEPDLGSAGRTALRPLAQDFFAAAAGDLNDIQSLHQLRICAKRLRYAMELLAGAFDSSFRKELYPVVGELQARLGEVNDHAAAQSRFQKWLDEEEDQAAIAGVREQIAIEEAARDAAGANFRAWWTPERADDFQRRLLQAIED